MQSPERRRQHREARREMTRRLFHAPQAGTRLGWIWTVLGPFLTMVAYTLVFGGIFGGTYGGRADETVWDYAVGVYLSLTLHGFLAEILGSAPGLLSAHDNLLRRTMLPPGVLPESLVLAATGRFGIGLALTFLAALTVGAGPAATAWQLPLVLLPLVILGLGLAHGLAALGERFRDLGQVSGLASTLLLWGSAVFFPVSLIPPSFWAWLRFNPLLQAVDLARDAALWGRSPLASPIALAYLWLAALAALLAGRLLFSRRPA